MSEANPSGPERSRRVELDFRRPAKELFPAFERFRDAFLADDHDMWPAGSHWGAAKTSVEAYLNWLERCAEGRDLPPLYVPSDTFWVFAGDEMAGELHIRHFLRGSLIAHGGHVGYSVQPKFRRRGVASAMLRFACDRLREMGEHEALITLWDDNVASAGVVEKAGGVRIHDSMVDGRAMRRYLIPLV